MRLRAPVGQLMAIAVLPFQNSARTAAGSKSSSSAGPSFGGRDQFLQGPHEGRPGDGRFQRLLVKERRVVVALLGIGGSPSQEHEPRPTAGQRLDRAVLHPGLQSARLGPFLAEPSGQFLIFLPSPRRFAT